MTLPDHRLAVFWSRIPVGSDEECWEWQGARAPFGYGVFKLGSRKTRTVRSHRLVYELKVGEIPDGLLVLHRCDNPPCCNPAHLFVGTHQDNMDDMFAKERRTPAIGGGNHGTAKLTPEIVREIKRTYQGRRGERKALLARLGIGKGTLQCILEGKTWKHVA